MGADVELIARTATNTNLAAAAGGISALITAWITFGKPNLAMTLNGVVAGLVAITCSCTFVDPWVAIVFFGLLPGAIVVFSVRILDSLGIDDPVGAISAHATAGVLGTILLGLFHTEKGLLYGGGSKLLIAQVVGTVSVFVFCMVSGLILFKLIQANIGLRVTKEEEVDNYHQVSNRL